MLFDAFDSFAHMCYTHPVSAHYDCERYLA